MSELKPSILNSTLIAYMPHNIPLNMAIPITNDFIDWTNQVLNKLFKIINIIQILLFFIVFNQLFVINSYFDEKLI